MLSRYRSLVPGAGVLIGAPALSCHWALDVLGDQTKWVG